jgi:hydroxymethylbilane synthase
LEALDGCPPVEIVEISTSGDRIQNVALSRVAGRDFFTKDIEEVLLGGEVDLAVHSLKDLATDQPGGLMVCATLLRADPRDALVAPPGTTLASLPAGAVVGTSSLRRKAFLAAARPDLKTRELRGNVPTRVQRWRDGDYDALLLASAGLDRLEMGEVIAERVSPAVLTPAPAQGAVAIQIRSEDERAREWISRIDHAATHAATRAERKLLNTLEGGCQVPVGALAVLEDDELHLTARVASLDGTRVLHAAASGPLTAPEEIGARAAEELIQQGADELLDSIRAAAGLS